MSRTQNQWLNEIGQDMGLIRYHIDDRLETPTTTSFASAIKEARRLQSDLYRFAAEVYGITKEDIDKVNV